MEYVQDKMSMAYIFFRKSPVTGNKSGFDMKDNNLVISIGRLSGLLLTRARRSKAITKGGREEHSR